MNRIRHGGSSWWCGVPRARLSSLCAERQEVLARQQQAAIERFLLEHPIVRLPLAPETRSGGCVFTYRR